MPISEETAYRAAEAVEAAGYGGMAAVAKRFGYTSTAGLRNAIRRWIPGWKLPMNTGPKGRGRPPRPSGQRPEPKPTGTEPPKRLTPKDG